MKELFLSMKFYKILLSDFIMSFIQKPKNQPKIVDLNLEDDIIDES